MKKFLITFLSVTLLLVMGCAKENHFYSHNAQPVPTLQSTSKFTHYNVFYREGQKKLKSRQKDRIASLLQSHDSTKYLVLSPCRDYRRVHIAITKARFKELYYYLKQLNYKVSPKKPITNACTNVNMLQVSTYGAKIVLPNCRDDDG